jgi:hypothetical protein
MLCCGQWQVASASCVQCRCRAKTVHCMHGAEPRLCIACMHILLMHRHTQYILHACMHARPAVPSGCWLAEAAASSSVRACGLLPPATASLHTSMEICVVVCMRREIELEQHQETRSPGPAARVHGPTMAAQRRFLSSRPTGAREMGSGLNWASFLGPGPPQHSPFLTAAYVLKPRDKDKDKDMNP